MSLAPRQGSLDGHGFELPASAWQRRSHLSAGEGPQNLSPAPPTGSQVVPFLFVVYI